MQIRPTRTSIVSASASDEGEGTGLSMMPSPPRSRPLAVHRTPRRHRRGVDPDWAIASGRTRSRKGSGPTHVVLTTICGNDHIAIHRLSRRRRLLSVRPGRVVRPPHTMEVRLPAPRRSRIKDKRFAHLFTSDDGASVALQRGSTRTWRASANSDPCIRFRSGLMLVPTTRRRVSPATFRRMNSAVRPARPARRAATHRFRGLCR